jgi:hypothetical protein
MRPYLEKNPSHKRAGGVTQGEASKFKAQYGKKKKKKKEILNQNSSHGLGEAG